jgi:hypothetical protein
VRIRKVGSHTEVWVDGTLLHTFDESDPDYASGRLSLASGLDGGSFDDVRVCAP